MKKLYLLCLVWLIVVSSLIQVKNSYGQWTQMSNGMGTNYLVKSFTNIGSNIFAGTNGYGVFKSSNYGVNWIAVNSGLTSLYVLSLAVNGTNIFAGTLGGVYRSTNNGFYWTSASSGLISSQVNALGVSGTNIFAGTNNGVSLSTDNGDNWVTINNGLPNLQVNSFAISGINIFIGTSQGVYLTTDNGNNWTLKLPGITVYSVAFSGRYLFAGTYQNGIKYSTNLGSIWYTGGTTSQQSIYSLATSGNNIFAGTSGGFYSSTNNSASWSASNVGFTTVPSINSIFLINNYIFAGTGNQSVWRSDFVVPLPEPPTLITPGNNSENNALNLNFVWGRSTTASLYHIIVSTDAFFINVVLNDSTLSDTTKAISDLASTMNYYWKVRAKNSTGWSDFSSYSILTTGVPWVQMSNGIGNSTEVYSFTISNGTNLFAGTQGSGVFLSTNNGINWSAVNSGLPSLSIKALTTIGNNIFAGVNGYGIYFSSNSGGNWSAINSGLTNYQVTSFALNGTNIFAGTYGSGVFVSTNNGLNWISVNYGISNGYVNALCVNNGNIYAGTNGGIFRSTDNGGSWTGSTTTLSIVSLASNALNIYAGANNVGIWRSTNNGLSWSQVIPGSSNQYVNCLAVNESKIFAGIAGANGGMFLSTNNGNNWLNINLGLSDPFSVSSLIISNNYVFAGTMSTSVWRKSYTAIFPSPPFQISPINNSTENPFNVNLIWSKPQYATGYNVVLSRDSLFRNIVFNDSLLSDSIKAVTGLAQKTKYFWGVKAKNEMGWGTYSSVWNFTTTYFIDSIYPKPNKLSIPLSTGLNTYFHLNMNNLTMDTNGITIFGSMSGRKKGLVNYNPSTKIFQFLPNIPFKYGELVSTTLDTGLKTSTGNSIEPFMWSFTSLTKPSNLLYNLTNTVTVGSGPIGITTGDFDGDGNLDIASCNSNANTISILKNNGIGVFSLSSTVTTGSYPMGIVTGDFDGDGKLDIATANRNSGTVTIFKNNGAGSFTLSSTLSTGGNPKGIVTGDFDNDGYLDLAVTKESPYSVSTLKNNGSGTFSVLSTVTVTGNPYGITTGDFDNDGHLELATTNQGPYAVTILKIDGSGVLSVLSTITVTGTPFGIVANDFDNDGYLDIAVTNQGPYTASILKNNGSGAFNLSSTVAVGTNPNGIIAGDFDGDGDIDLCTANSGSYNISVLKNNGTGTFTLSTNYTVSGSPFGITTGDFNNDGVLDFSTANNSSSSISILTNLSPPLLLSPLNNSTGNLNTLNFTWNKLPGASNYRMQIATDSLFSNLIVNDSTLIGTDSIKTVSGLNALTWYYWRMNSKSANGTSLWSDTWKFKTQGTPAQVVLIQPTNNSVNQPVEITFKWSKALDQTASVINSQLSINNGKTKTGDSPLAVSNYWLDYSTDSAFATGVISDSTLSDTIKSVTNLNTGTSYFWKVKARNQTGWGNFSSIWKFTTIFPLDSVSPRQNKINVPLTSDIKAYFHNSLNGSTIDSNSISFFGSLTGKKRGVISYNSINNSIQLVPNSPFKYGELISTTLDTGIKTSLGTSISPYVWSFKTLSKPSNYLLNQVSSFATAPLPYRLVTADIDNDGDLDLIVNHDGNGIRIFKNNGSGTFTLNSTLIVGGNRYGMTTGDVDGDGDVDLILTNNNTKSVEIYKNNGLGTFTLYSTISLGINPYGVAAGDYDGDGNLDLAVAEFASTNVVILKNNGAGDLSLYSSVALASAPYELAIGDFDKDGYLDIAVSHSSANYVSILKNNGAANFSVSSTISAGTSGGNIAVGDIDGDGNLDLAVTYNDASGTLKLLKNNGAGIFSTFSTISLSHPTGVEFCDFDGDGDLDLCVSNSWGTTVSAFKNNGSGTFSLQSNITVGTYPGALASGDFDKNGVMDIAVANNSSNTVSILMNLTPPVLTAPVNNSTGNLNSLNFTWNQSAGATNYRFQLAPDSLFSNLVINDSALTGTDITKAVSGLNSLTWYYWRVNSKSANGNSLWSDTWKFKTLGSPTQVVLSTPANNATNQSVNQMFKWFKATDQTEIKNIKGQSKNSEAPVSVSNYWFELATDSAFTSIVTRDSSLTDTTKSMTGLLNATNYFWRVKGKNQSGWATYSAVWKFTTITYYIDSVSPNKNKINVPLTSNINAWFHQSVNSSTIDSNSVTFFGSMTGRKRGTLTYNSGNNSMQVVPVSPFKYGEMISTTLDSGIKTSAGNSITPFVWSFTTMAKPSNSIFNKTDSDTVGTDPCSLITGDFDGDGDLDIAVNNNSSGTVSILKNNGSGKFASSSTVTVGGAPEGIAGGDFDNDGDLDIAVINASSLIILKNNGTGTFSVFSSVPISNSDEVVAGDIDGDGDLDLVVTCRNSNISIVLKNDGVGNFTISSTIPGNSPLGISIGDFDNDGDLDLCISEYWAYRVAIYKNSGTGTFTFSSYVSVGSNVNEITNGDFNNDGYLDIAVTNEGSAYVSVLINNGTGAFTTTSFSAAGVKGKVACDFDGDGDLDLVTFNYVQHNMSIFRNNGTGTFTLFSTVPAGNYPIYGKAGDFNNDGIPDIAVANNYTTLISILYNITPPVLTNPANNSTGNLNSLTFLWNKSYGASNYRIQIATDSLFSNIIVNDSTLTGTDSLKAISGLNALTWYYWRMNSKSANGTSLMSDTWKFKTQGVPYSVNLFQPVNNAVNQPVNITFNWFKTVDQTLLVKSSKLIVKSERKEKGKENISDSPLTISNYWFEYSTDSTFNTNTTRDSLLTDTTKTVSGLNNITKYFWRVKAKNQTGWSAFSNSWNFTTVVPAPVAPTLLTPVNGSVDQSVTLTLDWNDVTYATGYRVQVSASSSFTTTVYDTSGLTLSQITIPAGKLSTNSLYYWKVNATNVSGTSLYSAVWNFTTSPNAPNIPQLSLPANNSTGQPTNVAFNWFKAIETYADTKSISKYWFEYGIDSLFISIIGRDSTLTDTTKTISGLNYYTKYFWRVKAKNQTGWGSFSNVWNFTTIVPVPSAPVLTTPVNNAAGVSLTPSLIWGTTSYAVSYRIQVSADSTFATTQYDTSGVTGITVTIPAGKLTGLTKYYWRVNAANVSGTGPYSAVWNFTTLQNLTLNLKVYLEGFWDGASQVSDTVTVYLANSINYTFTDSARVFLSTTGTSNIIFNKASNGSYYVIVNHRNHLETWSKLAQSFVTNVAVNYDFTTSSAQAYGDNMKQVGSVWVLFGGDANRDGSIDALDVIYIVNQFGMQGYLQADFNGDNDVTGMDVALFVPNFGMTKIIPSLVVKPVIKKGDYDLSRIVKKDNKKEVVKLPLNQKPVSK